MLIILMAFAGTFISHIEKVFQRKSNLTTAHQQPTLALDGHITNSSSSGISANSLPDNSNEYIEANYPGVLDSDLTSLTIAQRNIFLVMLTITFVLSICGNICTLFVNFHRKLRPFFRVCLISLACSDLMNTVFLATSYYAQFTADFVQIWSLGDVLCSLVPFSTTCAILASSMTLVGIALDRYFAVMKVAIGFWDPSLISCIACMLCIWLASISIACPVFTFYDLQPIYILTEVYETSTASVWPTTILATDEVATINTANTLSLTTKNGFLSTTSTMPSIKMSAISKTSTATTIKSSLLVETATKSSWEKEAFLVSKEKLVNMCLSDQKNVSAYYAIVFAIIFVPCIVAFFWFNSVIARKLWKRRHNAALTKQRNFQEPQPHCKPRNTGTTPTLDTAKTEQATGVSLQTSNCHCKSVHATSSTSPSSLANTLCGHVNTAEAKSEATSTSLNVAINNTREARHLRMFTVILVMMAVFVFLRLPAWIFLLMRLYGKYSQPYCWLLYFIFGLMNLSSSALNPFFYTFLTETIQYALRLKTKISSLFCGCCIQRCCCSHRGIYGNSNSCASSLDSANRNEVYPCVLNMENIEQSGFQASACYKLFCGCSDVFCCHQTRLTAEHEYNVNTHSLQHQSENCSKKSPVAAATNDKDEGVDCNDEVDEGDVASFDEYNQRIYAIFPTSLVSSSINSENS